MKAIETVRSGCLEPYSDDWLQPTAEEIADVIKLAGNNKTHLAKTLGVQARQVRRWAEGEPKIPYAAWALLCYEAGLGAIWRDE